MSGLPFRRPPEVEDGNQKDGFDRPSQQRTRRRAERLRNAFRDGSGERGQDAREDLDQHVRQQGSLAEQDIKGIISIVNVLSFVFSMDFAAIMAGTLHPKPISIGTNEWP